MARPWRKPTTPRPTPKTWHNTGAQAALLMLFRMRAIMLLFKNVAPAHKSKNNTFVFKNRDTRTRKPQTCVIAQTKHCQTELLQISKLRRNARVARLLANTLRLPFGLSSTDMPTNKTVHQSENSATNLLPDEASPNFQHALKHMCALWAASPFFVRCIITKLELCHGQNGSCVKENAQTHVQAPNVGKCTYP